MCVKAPAYVVRPMALHNSRCRYETSHDQHHADSPSSRHRAPTEVPSKYPQTCQVDIRGEPSQVINDGKVIRGDGALCYEAYSQDGEACQDLLIAKGQGCLLNDRDPESSTFFCDVKEGCIPQQLED